jgi:hypothetical protein
MKIVVDLVRVRQEWDPDTREQHNCLVIRIADREFEVQCAEEDVAAVVASAVHGDFQVVGGALGMVHSAGWIESRDEVQDEVVETFPDLEDEDEGVVSDPPSPFASFPEDAFTPPEQEHEPTAQETRKAQIKAKQTEALRLRHAQKEDMKRRARQVPPRRVSADEMGYPEVPQTAPQAARTLQDVVGDVDEDGFQQG